MNYINRLKGGLQPSDQPRRERVPPGARRMVQDIIPPSPRHTTAEPVRPSVMTPQPLPARPAPVTLAPPIPPRSADVSLPALRPDAVPWPSQASNPEAKTDLALVMDENLPIRTWEPTTSQRKRTLRRVAIWSGVGLGALIFFVTTFSISTFAVTIYPRVISFPLAKLDIIADTGITTPDPAAKRVPAIMVNVEKTLSRDYPSTGTKLITVRAQGTVTIKNSFNSSPQPLVASTRLEDPSGKIFRLRAGLTIPGAKVQNGRVVPSSVTATIIADQPGDGYNIGPTEFHIPGFRGTPKYDGFTAKSAAAFSGGFTGQVAVASAPDIAQASEDITKRLVDAVNANLDAKVPADPDFLAPPGGRETAILSVTQPKVGAPGARFTISASARGRLLAVKKSQVLLAAAQTAIPASRLSVQTPPTQHGLVITANGLGAVQSMAHLTVSGDLAFYHESNTVEILDILHASTPKKAEAYLRAQEEIDSFRIKRFPRWLWFIPGRPSGLSVTVAPPT